MYVRDIYILVKTHPKYFKTHGEVIQRRPRANIMNFLYQGRCQQQFTIKKDLINNVHVNYLSNRIKFLNGPSFKSQLIKWFLTHCFHSTSEYLEVNKHDVIFNY